MKLKKLSKFLKKLIIIVGLILIVLIGILLIKELNKYKYKKILIDNDSLNYEITQIMNGKADQNVKLRNNTLVINDGNNIMWVSGSEDKSIIINETEKTAIVTSESNMKIASLNETYIKEFFENSDNEFKYLGKEDNYALLQFSNENTGLITVLYLNLENNLIENQVTKNDIAEVVIEYQIKVNSVSLDEVKEPDLSGYNVINQ